MASTESVAPKTFHDELTASDMRIALYPELLEQEYVLECGVCRHATILRSAANIEARCGGCGLWLGQAGGRFWVLVPKSTPIPEEE